MHAECRGAIRKYMAPHSLISRTVKTNGFFLKKKKTGFSGLKQAFLLV
jgi:hypothetical protein